MKRWYPLGSELVVYLFGGRQVTGSLQEVEADSLVLTTDRGPVLLHASGIEQVEQVAENARWTPVENMAPAAAASQPSVNRSPEWSTLLSEFAPQPKQPMFTAPSFRRDMSIPLSDTDALALDKELERLSNQYLYARKVREPHRIHAAVKALLGLAERYHYPPAYHLAALLLLDIIESPGQPTLQQAEEWLSLSAHLGGQYSWDLATLWLRLGRDRDAMQELGRTLTRSPAEDITDPVLTTWVSICAGLGETSSATEVLTPAVHCAPGQRMAAVRASLYLLYHTREEEALKFQNLLALPVAQYAADHVRAVLSALRSDNSTADATAPPLTAAPTPHTGLTTIREQTTGTPGEIATPPLGPHIYSAAENHYRHGRFEMALQIAEKGLLSHPDNPKLLAVARDARLQVAAKGRPSTSPAPPRSRAGSPASPRRKAPPAPQGDSLYAQAKRAEHAKRFARAEELYERAIQNGDSTERSVRSLAWMLHGRKRSEEALQLLADPSYPLLERLPHHNMVISILGDLGRWADSAVRLEELIAERHPIATQVGLLKRLIYAHQQDRDWPKANEAARRLLALDPDESEFKDIAAELERVKSTGIFTKLDALLADANWTPEQSRMLSPLLSMHLDECEYAGVPPTRVQGQRLGERDLKELESLIGKLGVTRPGDRAAFNLSTARILYDLSLTDDPRFRKALRSFAAAMGDLCSAEGRPGDVTRTYYAESVSLGHWDDTGRVKVRQFIVSYHAADGTISGDPPNFEGCLTSVLAVRVLRQPVLLGLLSLATFSDIVGKEIINKTYTHKKLRKDFTEELCGFLSSPAPALLTEASYLALWQEALRRFRLEISTQRQSLQVLHQRGDVLSALTEEQEELERVRQLSVTTRLDSERLRATSEILGELRHYMDQSSYLEQERLESLIRSSLQERISEIRTSPTRFSLEHLAPYLERLGTALGDHFAEAQKAAEPATLSVSSVLSSYVPDATSTIQVQLTVENDHRRSPAGDVKLRVLDNPDDYRLVETVFPVAHSLRDGQKETCVLPLVVTSRAATDKVLTLRYSLEFTVRAGSFGRSVATEPESLSVRLDDPRAWRAITNPYAEGAPVEDRDMFYGRDPLIRILADSLARSEAKSVVIYGQKRAGKSSVLFHLQRALDPPLVTGLNRAAVGPQLLAARFSLLELASNLDHPFLLYKIARAFYSRFEDLSDDGYPVLDVSEPRLDDFTTSSAPQIQFEEYMARMRRKMRQTDPYRDWRLVLLLDEFTMLYSAIERNDLPRGFMKTWKAMLESKLFSSVVVGNDLMPAFLRAYPNEFQVARQERVSYLDDDDARDLITKPVVDDTGVSRYKGNSVDRILELTARSPYYIQLFCNRLIEHMNAERQSLIGPADVDAVAAILVHSDKALLQEQFDNLLTPGDADVSALSEQTVLEVLHGCLTGHRRDLYLDGRKASSIPEGRRVLEDLVQRDVIARETEERFRIKVGLFAEWLWDRRV